MHPATILIVFVSLAALDLAWTLFLTALNYSSVSRRAADIPAELATAVSAEEAAKASSYSKAKMRLTFIATPVMTAVVIVAAATGLFGMLDRVAAGLVASAYWRGVLFLGALVVAQAILGMPVSLYSTFSLEKRFGFNTTTARTWLFDLAKSASIALAIGLPLLYLLYAFIDGASSLWWLWAAAIFSVIDLALSLIYPLVIAPLFNRFTPLPDGSLSKRIADLAKRLDFEVSGIFVMDGSKRSRHSNAYFTGLGRVKRIVLFDTLVSQMSEDEILAVLAHEIGHEKKRHVLKGTAVSIVLSLVAFWILDRFMGWSALYGAFGFTAPSKHALLLILSLVSGPATFFLAPAFSAWSRKHEYEADAYAVAALAAQALEGEARADDASAQAAGPDALSSALIKLGRENASNLWPHPLYSAWYYSHPTLRERLAAIRKAAESASLPRR